MNFRNVEIIKHSINNRGNIVELPPGTSIYDLDYYGKEVINGFNSVFYHQDRIYEFFKENGKYSLPDGKKRPYDGVVYSNYLIWDFDNKEDVDSARKDTIELVERLMAYSPTNIMVYFSGNKGFHVVYVCPELDQIKVDTHEHVVKNVCLDFGKGLKTLDCVIYDKMRVIRTPNSRHGSTKLFKVPLTYADLKSMSTPDIFKYAESQHNIKICSDSIVSNEDLLDLIKDNLDVKETRKAKTSLPELVEGIYNGFRENHNRNDSLTSLCGLLHSRDVPDDIVRALVSITNERNKVPLSESEVATICNSVGRYGVNSSKVVPTSDDIMTFEQAGEQFVKMKNLSGDFSFGPRYELINKVIESTMLGDVIGLVADSGVGKSTLGMDMLNEAAKTHGGMGLFVSLEMAAHACFFRAATITADADEFGEVSSSKVAGRIINITEERTNVAKEWNRVLLSDKSCDIKKLEKLGSLANEMYDGNVRYVCVDYAQYLDGATKIDEAEDLYREIKKVITRLNMVGIMLIQTNKLCPSKYTEIVDQYVSGVKALKQMLDFRVDIWMSKEDGKRLHGKFSKTRWEKDNDGNYFDLVRDGLKYHTEVVKPEMNNMGGL